MMKTTNVYDVIYTHTEGEPLCIVHSGITYPFGSDILAKRRFLEESYDWLRRALMREPRGHHDMFGVFVTPPSSADTDAGLIWIDGDRFVDMCGHGTIGLSMAMVANGLTQPAGELTTIRFETTAGPVRAEVRSGDRGVEWSSFENVPAFVAAPDVALDLPEIGAVKADISFGGNYFCQIDLSGTDVRIRPESGRQLSELGLAAKAQINERIQVEHPTQPHIDTINFVTFFHEPERADSLYRCVHVFSDGKLDRSPGGTGTSAMLAKFVRSGDVVIGQTIRSEGLLGGGQFEGCAIRETQIADQQAIVPTVKGTASMLGYAKWTIDPDDPIGAGFVVS